MGPIEAPVQVPLTLDRKLYERIEDERGLVPRARWVRELIRKAIEAGVRP